MGTPCSHIDMAERRLIQEMVVAGNERRACAITVELLSLAHERGCEAALAQLLEAELDAGRLPDLQALRERFQSPAAALTNVVVDFVPLSVYDELGTVRPGAAA